MGQITWVKSVSQLLKNVDHLQVIGSRPHLQDVAEAFPGEVSSTLSALWVSLSDAQTSGTSLTGRARPTWVTLSALPKEASRHNHPARPDALGRMLGPVLERSARKVAVALVGPAEHQLPLVNALYRAVPLFGGPPTPDLQVLWIDASGQASGVAKEILQVAESAQEAASWVDTPPSEMHPARFTRLAKDALAGLPGVKVSEIVGDRLQSAGLGGIYGVGKAAEVPPRMLVLQAGPQNGSRHVALVGKGVTFDTGGLHLKPRGSMEGMKSDMGGAAAVFGAFNVLARQKLSFRVTAILCLAENAIGPKAFKPDDILTLHSKKTVEINNTDAEGRLLLADGVSWAARKMGADTVIDAATLTGAQLVSTGMLHGAVVSNDPDLEDVLVQAGRRSGDLVHPLLFAPELFQQEFKSPVADMRNSVKNRMNAQCSCAGQFVYSHLEGTKVTWGHVDLAGPAFRNDRGTGFGVALLAETVQAWGAAEPNRSSPRKGARPRKKATAAKGSVRRTRARGG